MCCLENRLCLVVLFVGRISPLPSLNLVYYCHYLFQKARLYSGVLNLSQTCLFVMNIMLSLPVLTD